VKAFIVVEESFIKFTPAVYLEQQRNGMVRVEFRVIFLPEQEHKYKSHALQLINLCNSFPKHDIVT